PLRMTLSRQHDLSTGRSGPHDFTSASALLVGVTKHACQGGHGHRIPASRVVTIARNAPLLEAGCAHDPRFR
ncbi:hypothetical protein, partial [Bradyrhizobium sp. SZCCHNR2023]|uniref:hypothetical protein n=1 Tax=Bradyrhizobium sp. SZCCHNR2023 TaxID=3057380 RepID=UPI003966FD6E